MTHHEPLTFEIRNVRGGDRAYPVNVSAERFVALFNRTTLTMLQLVELVALVPVSVTHAENVLGYDHLKT